MAAYTLTDGQFAAHEKTLGASTVDTVTIPSTCTHVEVLSIDGVDEIYFTVDGSTPTVSGAATFVVPAAIGSRTVRVLTHVAKTTVVKLISTGIPKYSVTGLYL
jgi:hypothetical protein